MRFAEYKHKKTLTTNRAALLITTSMLLVYVPIDGYLFPPEDARQSTIMRLSVILPCFLAAFVLSLRAKTNRWITPLTVIGLISGISWFHVIAGDTPERDYGLVILFCVHTQVLLISFLLFNFSLRYCVLLAATSLILASYTFVHPQAGEITNIGIICFLFILVLTITFLFLAVTRERHEKALFRNTQYLHEVARYESQWREVFPSVIQGQFAHTEQAIIPTLNAISENETYDKYIRRAQRSFVEIQILIHKLISNARKKLSHHGKSKERYPLSDHLYDIFIEIEARYPKSSFSLSILDEIYTDVEPALLTRLCMNLCDNAVRHNEPSATIELTIQNKTKLSIANQGAKLTTDLKNLIDLGGQGSNKGQYGLGLYICNQICQGNDLVLNACNLNHGVEFSVTFPDKGVANG